jgi:hypothetical protein
VGKKNGFVVCRGRGIGQLKQWRKRRQEIEEEMLEGMLVVAV